VAAGGRCSGGVAGELQSNPVAPWTAENLEGGGACLVMAAAEGGDDLEGGGAWLAMAAAEGGDE
jgi:hypothetical protein